MDRASNSSEPLPADAPHVLLVDDSAVMRRSLRMSLELGGYRVTVAGNGEEALMILRAGLVPDLLLTDIVMPGMDGLALIEQARQLLRFTPIVALTTQTRQPLRARAKAAGATAWVLKPTGGGELLELVARFITTRRRAPGGKA